MKNIAFNLARCVAASLPANLITCCGQSTCLVFVLFSMLALPATMHGQFTYTTNQGTITITKYTGPGGSVTIPEAINGLPVVTIGNAAFSPCSALTDVTIPNMVSRLGANAFQYCFSLTNVVLPNALTNIEDYAFEYCGALTAVPFPNSLTSIGNYAFQQSGLTTLTPPYGLSTIGSNAFYACANLSEVSLPSGLTSISASMFGNCSRLMNLTLPASVTDIGRGRVLWVRPPPNRDTPKQRHQAWPCCLRLLHELDQCHASRLPQQHPGPGILLLLQPGAYRAAE